MGFRTLWLLLLFTSTKMAFSILIVVGMFPLISFLAAGADVFPAVCFFPSEDEFPVLGFFAAAAEFPAARLFPSEDKFPVFGVFAAEDEFPVVCFFPSESEFPLFGVFVAEDEFPVFGVFAAEEDEFPKFSFFKEDRVSMVFCFSEPAFSFSAQGVL